MYHDMVCLRMCVDRLAGAAQALPLIPVQMTEWVTMTARGRMTGIDSRSGT